jgi:hypothetical protein
MGVRARLTDAAHIAVLGLLIAVLVAIPADGHEIRSFPAEASRCERPSTRTLVETGKVRVYARKEHSVELPDPDRHAIGGRPVFACLKSIGVPRLLDLPEAGGEKRALWVSVAPDVLAVSAPLVAYAFTQYYIDTHETWIRVRDLGTGAVLRSCPAGGDIAPGALPVISRIVVDSQGALAWSAEGQEGNVIWDCDRSGPHQLDQGEGVELESLSLEAGVLHWLDGENEHEALL